jgi:hypothetical protein
MRGTTMNTNRTRFEHLDEPWIAKYRAALCATPVPQSRFAKICASLRDARNTLLSQLQRILKDWSKTQRQKSSAANQPAVISSSRSARHSVKRIEVSDKNGFKRTAAKRKRPRPLLPTQKYRAG